MLCVKIDHRSGAPYISINITHSHTHNFNKAETVNNGLIFTEQRGLEVNRTNTIQYKEIRNMESPIEQLLGERCSFVALQSLRHRNLREKNGLGFNVSLRSQEQVSTFPFVDEHRS